MEATHLTDWLPRQIARAEFWEHPSSLLAADARAVLPTTSSLPAGSVCFATSGSTGQPSWVVLSKDALLLSAAAVNQHLQVTSSSHWGLALPLHHVGGFGVAARACQADCRFSTFGPKWDAGLFHQWLGENHITHTSLVPTQVHDLVRAHLTAPAGLAAIVVGGGRLATPLGQAARDLGWPVLASYGMTEAASQIATCSPRDLAEIYQPDPLPPLPIWQLQTTDESRLRIAGSALLHGWLRDTNGTWAFHPREDEWLTTNDIAELTPAGLRILGRADGLVKILGELVCPERIETDLSALFTLPLAVIALPDDRSEHRLVPVFEHSTDPKDIEALLSRHHASCPGHERLAAPVFIHALPRTTLGKIRRKELADLIRAAIDSTISTRDAIP
jgi:O-succinylbenzoic acid--CoA ligase